MMKGRLPVFCHVLFGKTARKIERQLFSNPDLSAQVLEIRVQQPPLRRYGPLLAAVALGGGLVSFLSSEPSPQAAPAELAASCPQSPVMPQVLPVVVKEGPVLASIDQAAQDKLLARIRVLEQENATLRENKAVAERLVGAKPAESGVRVESFRFDPETANGVKYRYRMILGFTPDKATTQFQGTFQLAVDYLEGGREKRILLPEGKGLSANRIELKRMLRKEGVVSLPAGVKLKSVELRVIQGDVIRAREVFTPAKGA